MLLKSTFLILFLSIWHELAPAFNEAHLDPLVVEAIVKGEEKLLQCVVNSRARVPVSENKKLLSIWNRELRSPMTMAKVTKLLKDLDTFSPQGKLRGALLLKWLRLDELLKSQGRFSAHVENRNLIISLNSLMMQIFTERPFANTENIQSVTSRFKTQILKDSQLVENKKTNLIHSLGLFEEAIIVEMKKTHSVVKGVRAEFEAQARPIIFAVGGTATFAFAMLSAEPILATSIGFTKYLGLGAGLGQTLGTGAIAGIGVTGIEAVVEIAIPLWIQALQDSERRDIPLSCSLLKQAEISKAQELSQSIRAFRNGAGVGILITGVTLVTPKVFSILGGSFINYGEVRKINILVSAGKTFFKLADWVDEAALIFVVGAVGVGAISEANEAWSAYQESLSFNDLIYEVESELAGARQAQQAAKIVELEDLLRLVKSTQISFRGDALKHTIDVMVCGYLVYHFAHGEFIEAWTGGRDQIIETLALGADDTPVGIKAAYTAAKKAAITNNTGDPISIKIGLLKAKLVAMKLGILSPTLSQSYDTYINMDNHELDSQIHEIQDRVHKLIVLDSANPA
jgi:hypothetical protein